MSFQVANSFYNHQSSKDAAAVGIACAVRNRTKRNIEEIEASDENKDIHEAPATKRPRLKVYFNIQGQDDSEQAQNSDMLKCKIKPAVDEEKSYGLELSEEDDEPSLSEETDADDSLSWFDEYYQEEDGYCRSSSDQRTQVGSFHQKRDLAAYFRLQEERERRRRAAARLVHSSRSMRISNRFAINLYNTPSRSYDKPPSPVRCVRLNFENVKAWSVPFEADKTLVIDF